LFHAVTRHNIKKTMLRMTMKAARIPSVSFADLYERRELYERHKRRLGMTSREVAELVGLSHETVRMYPGWGRDGVAPTRETLAKMLAEIRRRAIEAEAEAERRVIEAEVYRRQIEDECAQHVAENPHLYDYNDDGNEDDESGMPSPSPVEGKSASKPAAAVAEGQPQAASRRNFPDLRSSSRPGKALQISPCPSTPAAAGPAQI
jgi:hypothetical protein